MKRQQHTTRSSTRQTARKANGSRKPDISAATKDFLNEGNLYAHRLYENGIEKLEEAQKNLNQYSDEALNKVRENPLTSILVAAGLGFLIAKLFKK